MNIDFSEIVWLDHHHEVSIDELVELSGFSQEELRQLVDSGALVPINPDEVCWSFSAHSVVSIRTLSRLKQDFELESNDIEQIVNILDPDSTKIISYDLFRNILHNSNNIEELLKNYYNSI